MENDFGAVVASWEEFYETIAGASGTLLGLLFVSLAINPKMMTNAGPNARRVWSEQTFHSFLVLLVIAIVALIPDQTPEGLGIPLLILGAQGLFKAVRDVRVALQDPDPHWRKGEAFGRFVSPVLGYALCLFSAILAFRGDPDAMGWLVAVNFLLMMSALISCWDLLKSIGEQSDQDMQQG
jgi:hypothetical protein